MTCYLARDDAQCNWIKCVCFTLCIDTRMLSGTFSPMISQWYRSLHITCQRVLHSNISSDTCVQSKDRRCDHWHHQRNSQQDSSIYWSYKMSNCISSIHLEEGSNCHRKQHRTTDISDRYPSREDCTWDSSTASTCYTLLPSLVLLHLACMHATRQWSGTRNLICTPSHSSITCRRLAHARTMLTFPQWQLFPIFQSRKRYLSGWTNACWIRLSMDLQSRLRRPLMKPLRLLNPSKSGQRCCLTMWRSRRIDSPFPLRSMTWW